MIIFSLDIQTALYNYNMTQLLFNPVLEETQILDLKAWNENWNLKIDSWKQRWHSNIFYNFVLMKIFTDFFWHWHKMRPILLELSSVKIIWTCLLLYSLSYLLDYCYLWYWKFFQCFDVFDESKSEFGVGMLNIFNVFDESES